MGKPEMNRSAKGGARSSLRFDDEGVLIHPPHQGDCGRHGTEEQRVTSGELAESPGGTGVSRPISESEVASDALSVVGRLNTTYEAWRKPRDRATGDRTGLGKAAGEDGREEKESQMSKDERGWNSSLSEKPVRSRPRRLVDWINLTDAKKVHSLIDKVYKRKNLEMAWEKVKENRGSGGVDGQSLAAFESQLGPQLARLEKELKENAYRPQPVLQHPIPKRDKPGEYRMLGVPTIYDRVCQQALLNRLEPIFEPVFDDASFGYRRGRSTKGALRKIWKEIQSGSEWIVDADLRDFFGSVDHEKLLTLVAQRVADGRVLRLIKAMLKAGSYGKGQLFPTERGTPQGGVVSPTLSNILLTPFDREMRLRGYQLTRFADDWVITCKSAAGARAAMEAAGRILKQLGVELHPQKTRIVHVRNGFEFLGYKIKRGQRKLDLPESRIRSQVRRGALYAYPKEKSIRRFMDRVRQRTKRRTPLKTKELIAELNPLLRGWGEYYKRAHVRKLFHRLDGWIVRRIWSHRYKRWRNSGWKRLPKKTRYRERGLVNLIGLIPSLASRHD
jgi:RNA-directed DNA polymerase